MDVAQHTVGASAVFVILMNAVDVELTQMDTAVRACVEAPPAVLVRTGQMLVETHG